MINLLPEERKSDINAARTNVLLLRYNFISLGLLGLVIVLCAGLYLVLNDSSTTAQRVVETNSAQATKYAKVETDANKYTKDLSVASQIFKNSISYTDLIISITKLLPPHVILEGLVFNSSSLSQQATLNAKAVGYDDAIQLKYNFEHAQDIIGKQLFKNVYFQGITQVSGQQAQSDGYNLTVMINVSLNVEALK